MYISFILKHCIEGNNKKKLKFMKKRLKDRRKKWTDFGKSGPDKKDLVHKMVNIFLSINYNICSGDQMNRLVETYVLVEKWENMFITHSYVRACKNTELSVYALYPLFIRTFCIAHWSCLILKHCQIYKDKKYVCFTILLYSQVTSNRFNQNQKLLKN